MKTVELVDERHINLMGLIVRLVFTDELATGSPGQKRRILGRQGTLDLYADEMGVRVVFGQAITISSIPDGAKANALVRGDMASLVGLMARKRFVWAVLSRRIRFRGNLLLLMRVFFVFLTMKREGSHAG